MYLVPGTAAVVPGTCPYTFHAETTSGQNPSGEKSDEWADALYRGEIDISR